MSTVGLARIALALICLTGLLGNSSDSTSAEEATKDVARVLLVTGEDYKGHLWQETSPLLRLIIQQDQRLAVDIVEDVKFLNEPQLHEYDSIVMHFKNYDSTVPGREAYNNLEKFVSQGGGLVLVHFACGAFQEFKEDFVKLAGRVWNPKLRGHDRRGEFTVDFSEAKHPITRGLESFETTDELYTCLEGTTPITVLAQARSRVDQKLYPMAFVHQHGQGRVFHTPLGHDITAFSSAGTAELIRRGTAWATGLDPTEESPAKKDPS